jgi:DNA-binding NarL/FixJ family response regulator
VTPIRVLIADDQPLVRAGLRAILQAYDDIEVVAEAGDGITAVAGAREHDPDVVLMDIRMPRLDGIQATQQLPGQRIIILTTFNLDQYILDALRAGASGFLLKDAPPRDLAHAIRVVAAGDALLSPAVTRRLVDQLAAGPAPAKPPPDRMSTLTERELEIFKLVARGLSNAEIARDLFITEGTVKSHVSRMLAKLGLRDRVQAAILAYETGLVR